MTKGGRPHPDGQRERPNRGSPNTQRSAQFGDPWAAVPALAMGWRGGVRSSDLPHPAGGADSRQDCPANLMVVEGMESEPFKMRDLANLILIFCASRRRLRVASAGEPPTQACHSSPSRWCADRRVAAIRTPVLIEGIRNRQELLG